MFQMSIVALPPVNEEVKRKIREQINLDDHSLKQALEVLKSWMLQQPHLPDEEGQLFINKCSILPHLEITKVNIR